LSGASFLQPPYVRALEKAPHIFDTEMKIDYETESH
jgi:hypothetical protein